LSLSFIYRRAAQLADRGQTGKQKNSLYSTVAYMKILHNNH